MVDRSDRTKFGSGVLIGAETDIDNSEVIVLTFALLNVQKIVCPKFIIKYFGESKNDEILQSALQ